MRDRAGNRSAHSQPLPMPVVDGDAGDVLARQEKRNFAALAAEALK